MKAACPEVVDYRTDAMEATCSRGNFKTIHGKLMSVKEAEGDSI